MAYNRLAGMIPEVWSSLMLSRMNEALVFANIVNRDYEGEIRNFGDVVRISEIGAVNINSYSATSTGALTIQSLSDAQKQLRIDQAKYFTFWLDDLDAAQTKPKVMGEALDNAAWGWANAIDEYVLGRYVDAGLTVGGTSSTGVDITSTNVIKYLSLAQQKLDETNTPPNGRWAVVPAWFVQKMTLARMVQDTNNSALLNNGRIGNFYGFDVYQSNNVVNGSVAGNGACVLFGYRGSVTLAVQILIPAEQARPSTLGFKTLVKGLVVFGAKVVRPASLGVLYADYTAEAT